MATNVMRNVKFKRCMRQNVSLDISIIYKIKLTSPLSLASPHKTPHHFNHDGAMLSDVQHACL